MIIMMNSNNNSVAFELIMMTLLSALKEQNTAKRNNQKRTLNTNKKINSPNRMNSTSKKSNLSIDERIENSITFSSNKYGVDMNLVKAIIKVESNFNSKVESCTGAKGLMQLMPEKCRILGISDAFDVEQNIDGGIRNIKMLLDRYNGDVEMALIAYNGGYGGISGREDNEIKDIYKMTKETKNYISKVMNYYRGT